MQESVLLHNVEIHAFKHASFICEMSHAHCGDDACSVFLLSKEFLTQNPKLNSCLLLLVQTMIQCMDAGSTVTTSEQ